MNTALRIINTLLLAAILTVLTLMFQRMPVTLADIKNAKPEARKAMLLKQAFVHLGDTVSVSAENKLAVGRNREYPIVRSNRTLKTSSVLALYSAIISQSPRG